MSFTLPEPPQWMQNRAYSARLDRQILAILFTEGVVPGPGDPLEVRERSTTPDVSVEVLQGYGIVQGDDEPLQGRYVVHVGAGGAQFVIVPMPPAPLTDQRIDLIVVRVNDATSGSTATPADESLIDVIQGTISSSPVAPALPASAIPIASVLRTAGDTAITNSMISDLRSVATQADYTVESRFQVLTQAQRNALTPFLGQTIYNSTTGRIETWDGSGWVANGILAVTTAERNALVGISAGYTVLNTDDGQIQTYDGTNWIPAGVQVVTTAQRLALTPFTGQVVYDTDLLLLLVWNGSDWINAGFVVTDTAGRNALTPYTGLAVFNTDTSQLELYDGANWIAVGVFAVTTAERNALTPYAGLTVYNTTDSRIQYYDGAAWQNLGQSYFEALTTTQRNALTPFTGQTIFNTTTNRVETYDGSGWIPATGIPPYTTAERNALTPYTGQVIFNTDVNRLQVYDGANWRDSGETYFDALTTTQRNALTPFTGQAIFNTTTNQTEVYDGANWQAVTTGSVALASLTDVDISGVGTGDVLSYNGSLWVDVSRSTLAGDTAFSNTYTPQTRSISVSGTGLSGGGNLTTDRTITISPSALAGDSNFTSTFAAKTPTVGTSLGTTGTVNLDMSALNDTYQSISASGAITFTTSNRAAGRSVTIRILAGASSRNLTFPSWVFVGSAAPASLAANKTGVLTLTLFGTADTDGVAAWAAQP